MSCGHTNAPTAFQNLINEVLKPLIRKFILIFFDNILVYRQNFFDHFTHLRLVLALLK